MLYYVLAIVVVLAFSTWMLRSYIASAAWRTTPGVILEAGVNQYKSNVSALSAERYYAMKFEAIIKYRYTWNGTDYQSDQVYAGFPAVFEDRKTADDIVSRFQPGNPVDVFVNPTNPASACLITSAGTRLTGYFILATTVLFGVGMVIVVIMIVTGRLDITRWLEKLRSE